MNLQQVFELITIIGGFLFIAITFLLGNSKEKKESEVIENIVFIVFFLSILLFVIGFFGLLIINL